MPEQLHWYLVRTKLKKERRVSAELAPLVPEVFLPLLDITGRSSGSRHGVVVLFPQYVFLRCNLAIHYFQVRYTPGVASFVSAGGDPLPVSEDIIETVRARCANGVAHLHQPPFRKGEPVHIVSGPFRGFDAVFDCYLCGAERVAVLLTAVETYNLRLVARATRITR